MKFVLFHGSFGSPGSNWLPELKDKLESLGQVAIAPTFPVDTWEHVTKAGPTVPSARQNVANWLSAFDDVYKTFQPGEKLCFVGHSLGPLFILHVVEKYALSLDSAIFVSPFLCTLNRSWQIDHVNKSFYRSDFDFKTLKKRIPTSYVLYSNNDPYVSEDYSKQFGLKLGSSMIMVNEAGHMNSDVHLYQFPLVLDLCISRVDLSLYHRYVSLQEKLGLTEYVSKTKGSQVKLKAEDALAEGVFRFRNLKKRGFFTFFTALTAFWDPNSRYMKDSRDCARKGKKLTRVFIFESIKDLNNPLLRIQMKLDFESGIRVYLCKYDDIKKDVAVPDFGITDDRYVCLVPYDKKTKKVHEIELNSSDKAIQEATRWEKIILSKANRLTRLPLDLERYVQSH